METNSKSKRVFELEIGDVVSIDGGQTFQVVYSSPKYASDDPIDTKMTFMVSDVDCPCLRHVTHEIMDESDICLLPIKEPAVKRAEIKVLK